MAKATIFYSWQSDLAGAANRNFIQQALEAALQEIGRDPTTDLDPVMERDTLGLPGSPNIKEAILTKIDAADAFVADVTPINAGASFKLTPNPNVMLELGYAMKVIGWNRIILVFNTAYGDPNDLPFDIRSHRCVTYHSPADATERAAEKRKLQATLIAAVKALPPRVAVARPFPMTLTCRAESISSERHDYLLDASITNESTSIVRSWVITVSIPRRVLRPEMRHFRLAFQGTDDLSVYRYDQTDSPFQILHPKSNHVCSIPYCMTPALHRDANLMNQNVTMTAYVNDNLVGELVKPFRELQHF